MKMKLENALTLHYSQANMIRLENCITSLLEGLVFFFFWLVHTNSKNFGRLQFLRTNEFPGHTALTLLVLC